MKLERKETDLILKEVSQIYSELINSDTLVAKLYAMVSYFNTLVNYGILDFLADKNNQVGYDRVSFYDPDNDVFKIHELQEEVEYVLSREVISDFPPPLQNINVPNSVKFLEVVKTIAEKIKINPISSSLEVYPEPDGLLYHLSIEEVHTILRKLDKDYRVIKILGEIEWVEDESLPEGGYYNYDASDYVRNCISVEILSGFIGWANIYLGVSQKDVKLDKDTDIAYQITYTPKREIIINNNFLVGNPAFDSENDQVFKFLYESPNIESIFRVHSPLLAAV